MSTMATPVMADSRSIHDSEAFAFIVCAADVCHGVCVYAAVCAAGGCCPVRTATGCSSISFQPLFEVLGDMMTGQGVLPMCGECGADDGSDDGEQQDAVTHTG